MQKVKYGICIFIIVMLILVIAVTLAFNFKIIDIEKQQITQEQLIQNSGISCDVYSNENGKILALITLSNEIGIQQIKYPDGEFILNCKGKKKVSVDYEMIEGQNYTFTVIDNDGLESQHEIGIDNLDNWIRIDIEAEKEKVAEANAIITFSKEQTNQYAIGANSNNWQNYSDKAVVDSYTVINQGLANEDGTVTIKARTVDKSGNIIQIEKEISCLDLDMPNAPVITQTSIGSYAIITTNGMDLSATAEVTYDDRDDITNYYSVDNGNTWQEYEGEFETQSSRVMAKSVKNESGLEANKQVTFTPTAGDALGGAAYDGKTDTYVQINSGTKKIKVASDMWNKNIKVDCYAQYSMVNANGSYIKFYNATTNTTTLSKKFIYEGGWTNGTFTKNETYTITIPSGTTDILFESGSNTAMFLRIKEIQF